MLPEPRVVGHHPLGDVRHRQVRHRPDAGLGADELGVADTGPRDVGVIDHHTLRRAGGTGRVDHGDEVARVGRGGGSGDVDRGGGVEIGQVQHVRRRQPVRVVHHDDLAQVRQFLAHLEQPRQQAGIIHDSDPGLAVRGEVANLLGR